MCTSVGRRVLYLPLTSLISYWEDMKDSGYVCQCTRPRKGWLSGMCFCPWGAYKMGHFVHSGLFFSLSPWQAQGTVAFSCQHVGKTPTLCRGWEDEASVHRECEIKFIELRSSWSDTMCGAWLFTINEPRAAAVPCPELPPRPRLLKGTTW